MAWLNRSVLMIRIAIGFMHGSGTLIYGQMNIAGDSANYLI